MTPNPDAAAQLNSTLGNYVGLPLVVLAIAGAIAGKGSARPVVGLAAVFGLLVWLTPGIL